MRNVSSPRAGDQLELLELRVLKDGSANLRHNPAVNKIIARHHRIGIDGGQPVTLSATASQPPETMPYCRRTRRPSEHFEWLSPR